jgi:hypothetical protein
MCLWEYIYESNVVSYAEMRIVTDDIIGHTDVYTYTTAYTHTSTTYIHAQTRIQTYTHTYSHIRNTFTNTYTQIHIRTLTHTHAQKQIKKISINHELKYLSFKTHVYIRTIVLTLCLPRFQSVVKILLKCLGPVCRVRPWGILYCYVMLSNVMLCHAMLCYVMLCYVMLCYVMLCYVIVQCTV